MSKEGAFPPSYREEDGEIVPHYGPGHRNQPKPSGIDRMPAHDSPDLAGLSEDPEEDDSHGTGLFAEEQVEEPMHVQVERSDQPEVLNAMAGVIRQLGEAETILDLPERTKTMAKVRNYFTGVLRQAGLTDPGSGKDDKQKAEEERERLAYQDFLHAYQGPEMADKRKTRAKELDETARKIRTDRIDRHISGE